MTEITQKILLEFFDYNPETGSFIRKSRDRKWFKNDQYFKTFEKRFSNKEVTCIRKGYYHTFLFGESQAVHRLIWFMIYGYWPNQIDHINGISTDNRLKNLRDVGYPENTKNKRMQKNNKSGIVGVRQSKSGNWIADIGSEGKVIHLGTFKTLKEAIQIRKDAEIKYGYHKNHGK